MEFAVWVFKHADDVQLQPHSGTILQKLLQLLNEGTACAFTPAVAAALALAVAAAAAAALPLLLSLSS